ncbi:MAG: 4-alpha-glucanotransferase [Syntrophobacteraceae bacterium]
MPKLDVLLTVPELTPSLPEARCFVSPVRVGGLVEGIFLPFHHMRSTTADPFDSRFDWGIGDFVSARDGVDFAASTGFHILQLLPIVWSAAFHSPYSVLSPQAMDLEYLGIPDLINRLQAEGMDVGLLREDVGDRHEAIQSLRDGDEIDHEAIWQLKAEVMERVWAVFRQQRELPAYGDFEAFREANRDWLVDDILYFLLKQEYMAKNPEIGWDWRVWSRYEPGIGERAPAALARARDRHADGILFHSFIQFVLYRQWHSFVAYATGRGVRIMMDMPFAPADARVWQKPEMVSMGGPETGYQRIEVQGVPGKKETPLGQIWQFTVYDYGRSASLDYIRSVFLAYRALGVTYIRIDHVPGYYQVFVFRQDVDEAFTLERLGVFDAIKEIREQALESGTEEARLDACHRVRALIIDALLHPGEASPRFPRDVLDLMFDEEGALLTDGNLVMVCRKLNGEEFGLRQQKESPWHFQWQTEDRIFRSQPHWQFLRITPNRRAGDDGFTCEWLFPDDPAEAPNPTDSIRIAYYRTGPGEAILYDFDRFAQESGMVVVLETLGNVTDKMLASSRRPGGYPLIPVIWGLEEWGRYYPAKFERNNCATLGVHDSYATPVAWRLLRHEDKGKLLRLFWPGRSEEELESYLEELKPDVNAMILKMVVAPHTVLKDFEPERIPAMVVLQLTDVFMLEDAYRLNFPGEQSSWKRRLPRDLWLPELLAAARGVRSSDRARDGVALLRRLEWARHATPLTETADDDVKVWVKPETAAGSLQVRRLNGDGDGRTAPFWVEVFSPSTVLLASILFLDKLGDEIDRLPLEKLPGEGALPEGVAHWAVWLLPRQEGVHRYRIELTREDGRSQRSEVGLLVAVEHQRSLNFLDPDDALSDIEAFRLDSPR